MHTGDAYIQFRITQRVHDGCDVHPSYNELDQQEGNDSIQSAHKFFRFGCGQCPGMTVPESFQSHAGGSDFAEGSIRAHEDTSI